jgi:hypothetical protein
MWVIAYVLGESGWCVVDGDDNVLFGPYTTHAEAVEAAQTAAWRISQGWKP